jgi:hypothetical protein
VAIPSPAVLTPVRQRATARWYALRLALVAALAVFALQLARLSDPARTAPDDFISSWAAGRLVASGENPYDASQVLAVQRTAHWTKDIPYRVWYPPWAMPILAAFGVLPYATGRFLWYLLTLAACLVSADLLWRYYGGPARLRAVLWPLVFTFWPAVITLRTGQISHLLLVGVAAFLVLGAERRWLLAGACLPLVAIKPQLLHLFWIAILLWVVREGRWRVLLGAVGSAAALTLIATALDPAVVSQFLWMAAHEAPQAPASTLGTALRFLVQRASGEQHFWLQFVPPVLSLAWFVPYAARRRDRWDWHADAGPVIVAALLTTAYGWIYDQIVLLVPIVQLAAVVARSEHPWKYLPLAAGYVAINAAILAMNVGGADPFWYIWVPFAFAAWWWAGRRA